MTVLLYLPNFPSLPIYFLRYFQCEPKFGLFAPAHKIKKIADASVVSEASSKGQIDSSPVSTAEEEKGIGSETAVSIVIQI